MILHNKDMRECLMLWSKCHNIKEVRCNIGTWDHGGCCIVNGIVQFYDPRSRLVIQFFRGGNQTDKLVEDKYYNIEDLCGEE